MQKKRKGLSVTEITICITLLVILISVGVYGIKSYNTGLKIAAATSNMSSLYSAHAAYYATNGSFTTDANLISSGYIIPNNMWNGSAMLDPWGNSLSETFTATTVTIELSAASQAIAGKNIVFSGP